MTEIIEIEEAGAAPTASDLNDAKPHCPASLNSAEFPEAPDGMASIVRQIDGADLLDRIQKYLARFVIYPTPQSLISHVLWIVHTHLMDGWFTTPRLAVLSPEPGSGKSRVLELTAILVPRPILGVMLSSSFIIRRMGVQDSRPTVLFDEADAIFGEYAKGDETLRAMANGGYRKGAVVGRCTTGKGPIETEELPIYGAIAFAGLDDLPYTIMDRAIVIRMRKPPAGSKFERFNPRVHELEGQALYCELDQWAQQMFATACSLDPELPPGVENRNADVWAPLLAIGELAGGRWPELARATAREYIQSVKASEQPTRGVQLLTDIRIAFADLDRMPTEELIKRLLADDESPWGDLRGRKLNARQLAKMLRPFGITSTTIRMSGDKTPKGYLREAFHDAWERYPSLPA